MAGIWELIKTTNDPDQERVNVSLFKDLVSAVALDFPGFNPSSLALAKLEDDFGRALTGAAQTIGTELGDWTEIINQASQGGGQQRLEYIHKVTAMSNLGEVGQTDETGFRSVLGIELT